MAKDSKESKSMSIFSLFQCCMNGDSKPKIRGKEQETKKGDDRYSTVEKGKEEVDDTNGDEQTSVDLELEYKPSREDYPVSLSDDYRPSHEDASETTSGGTSSVGTEQVVDSGLSAPGSLQLIQRNGTPSSAGGKEIGTGGRLNLKFAYKPEKSQLSVHILGVEFPPFQNWKLDDLEVSCMLLPIRQHSFRARPRKFKDPFTMILTPKDKIPQMSLRFRLYNHRAMSKHLIGQGVVNLGEITLGSEELFVALDLNVPNTYAIDSRYMTAVAGESQPPSEYSKSEILLSLEYRSLTRKLIAEVIKTRNLGLLSNSKPQDVGVEIKLLGQNGQVGRICRTSVKRHVIDAEFNEMFMFRVTYENLANIGLVFTLYRHAEKRGKRERIGEVCFGNQSSSHQQQNHWNEVMNALEKVTTQWHPVFK